MSEDLVVLFVGKDLDMAAKLTKIYGEEFHFTDCDYTNRLHKAIQSLREVDYNLCIITDSFPEEESKSFFADYDKLDIIERCVFVQVRKVVEREVDRYSLSDLGFDTIISEIGNHADRKTLRIALKEYFCKRAAKKDKVQIKNALDMVLDRIDNVARERKRGRDSKLLNTTGDLLLAQSELSEGELEKYFEKLTHKTEIAAPQNVDKVKIPKNVLKRQLPNLSENTYSGASARVWQKLLDRFGDTMSETDAPAAKTTGTEIIETEDELKKPTEEVDSNTEVIEDSSDEALATEELAADKAPADMNEENPEQTKQ